MEGLRKPDGLDPELVTVIERGEATWYGRLERALARIDDPRLQLRLILEESAVDHDASNYIKLWSLARRDEAARDLRIKVDDRFRRLVEEVVEEGQQAGIFRGPPADEVSLVLNALSDGFAAEATLRGGTVTVGYMLTALIEAMELLLECELTTDGEDDG
jgi:hypothetical protein